MTATSRTKLAAIAADAGARENGVERLDLVGGGEDRAADQPLEVRALGDQRVESRQSVGDGVGLTLVLGEREQGGGVAPGDAGNDRVFLCQARHLKGVESPHAPLPNRGANLRNSR